MRFRKIFVVLTKWNLAAAWRPFLSSLITVFLTERSDMFSLEMDNETEMGNETEVDNETEMDDETEVDNETEPDETGSLTGSTIS